MKFITLILLFVTNISYAKSTLALGVSSDDKYTVELETPMQMAIHAKGNASQRVSFENSVSDFKKIKISQTNKQKELLLVVLSVSNAEQSVKVLAFDKKVETTCSLKNEGDFSWDTDQELLERVRTISQGSKEKLQIKIGSKKSGKTEFSWVDCASF